MSERPLNPAQIQKDHALVHFFALIAGVDDIHDQMRLLVSGIGSFLRMDAVVLGFANGGTNACRVQSWHAGAGAERDRPLADRHALEPVVTRAMSELGCTPLRTLPLIHLARIMGYLAVARREPAELAAEESFLLSSFQTVAALLLSNDAERRQAEAAIARRNRILAGINRILQEALNCDSEEELGRTCLRVAEEITASKCGFIGEIGADGLLHDVAISNPGGAACVMPDPRGPRRTPGDFKLHGLYGRVLQDGKSLLCNAPSDHPDTIGIPAAHAPLTAFLGVPLMDGSRTIGMIAVGNRADGYRQEDLEALEALAPAIVQVFHRKKTERALIRSEKLVSVGRLAATIAHEINNPLEAATNAVFLVARDATLSQEGLSLAGVAERELRRAAQIARRTLGFYREPNDRTVVPVLELLRDLTALYESRLKNKDLEVRLRSRAGNAAVIANAGELRQLFSNLLANSIDAARPGGIVSLRIARSSLLRGTPGMRITVADTGTGIEPRHLKRVFEPFFTTKKDVGTGLGLWITEQIVRKHGGAIRIRSRAGHGTVVSVKLPADTGAQPLLSVAAGHPS